jgi:hypothetical protein
MNAEYLWRQKFRWLSQLASELKGAIEDHRNWINSDRASVLGTTFDVSGRLLAYAAYAALAYLAFNSFVSIRSGLAGGIYAITEQNDGPRVALFYILASGLAGPIILITIGIGIGWIYNLTTAAANRLFPRFVRPLIHPSIMLAVAAIFAAYHSAVTATMARGYLVAKANIIAASPQETASINLIENPSPEVQGAPEATGQDSPSDRGLVRLRSMFTNRPCANDGQGAELNPQSEDTRPEPSLAPGRDCRTEKPAPRDK